MKQVGEAVEDGDRGEAGQLLGAIVAKGAHHDRMAIAGQHPGGVPDRLAPAQLRVPLAQHHRVSAQLVDPDLEAGPRARRGLLEDHPQHPPRAGGVCLPDRAQEAELLGALDEGLDLAVRQVPEAEEVALARHHPSARTASMMASASSISARVTMSGGAKRTTLPPAMETSRPRSRALVTTGAASPSSTSPWRSPRPRAPLVRGRRRSASRSSAEFR